MNVGNLSFRTENRHSIGLGRHVTHDGYAKMVLNKARVGSSLFTKGGSGREMRGQHGALIRSAFGTRDCTDNEALTGNTFGMYSTGADTYVGELVIPESLTVNIRCAEYYNIAIPTERSPTNHIPDAATPIYCIPCDIDGRCIHGWKVWWDTAGQHKVRCHCICHSKD